ncbi:MAG: Fe-S cluster assembly ATPase SufC [Puniceicoccales bacterium]|jgi:Fe-S cluster assembly ATP-binding protein|nr:Fe-S cluster assembly ATPase SufC [Puniceicoccales bacterium]
MEKSLDKGGTDGKVSPMDGALSLQNVCVDHGDRRLVRDFSLELRPEELRVLMGPNGAGKSSLLKALAGHPDYAISSGSVLLDGFSVAAASPEERARRGLFLAFQSPVALPGISLAQLLRAARQERLLPGKSLDIMAFYGELHGALDALGMDRSWSTRSTNDGFSGGEQKRCELLQILLLKPRYLLLDEIDSGLDVDALRLVVQTLRSLQQEGAGILLVTHYQRLLESLSPDGVHLLQDGSLLRSGGMELARELDVKGFQ